MDSVEKWDKAHRCTNIWFSDKCIYNAMLHSNISKYKSLKRMHMPTNQKSWHWFNVKIYERQKRANKKWTFLNKSNVYNLPRNLLLHCQPWRQEEHSGHGPLLLWRSCPQEGQPQGREVSRKGTGPTVPWPISSPTNTTCSHIHTFYACVSFFHILNPVQTKKS